MKQQLKDSVQLTPDEERIVKRVKPYQTSYCPATEQARERENDLMLVNEYAADIFQYMREMEVILAPNVRHEEWMSTHIWQMRWEVVNILTQYHEHLNMHLETFFLAVNIFDRILSMLNHPSGEVSARKQMHERQCMIVRGFACLLIASKFEERNANVSLALFVYELRKFGIPIEDEDFRKLERSFLRMIDYNLGWPGPMSFLRRCTIADGSEIKARTLAKYILVAIQSHPQFLHYKPSLQAAAALNLGRWIDGRMEWDESMQKFSGYGVEQVEVATLDMMNFLNYEGIEDSFAYRVYSGKKKLCASPFVMKWIKQQALEQHREQEQERRGYRQLLSFERT
ncbi:cyclin-like protein [Gamsiella multidivaricata]|uniref:cyclin-like protein n=1 Tax=Gamsiella multidivaricata TaxID=101098 RepID=UPI00221F237E|nr:cyclin-like protein [Gamsiella multidivaricata]KAI7831799.1 cyclin-like protein [Gamsiella multidivaricata]